MNKAKLDKEVALAMDNTKVALQIMYDALNSGQKKKIVKDEQVKALFDRYGVEYTAE